MQDFCGAQKELMFYVGKRLRGGGNPLGFVGAVVTHSSVTKVCTKTIPSAYRKNISCNNESLKTIKSER